MLVFGYSHLGNRGETFEPSFSGSAWPTGGSVGPEGSRLCTLLFALASVVVAAWLREARYPQDAGALSRLRWPPRR